MKLKETRYICISKFYICIEGPRIDALFFFWHILYFQISIIHAFQEKISIIHEATSIGAFTCTEYSRCAIFSVHNLLLLLLSSFNDNKGLLDWWGFLGERVQKWLATWNGWRGASCGVRIIHVTATSKFLIFVLTKIKFP